MEQAENHYHLTNFDYEKEMEKALSTIFRNLRGIEETRLRVNARSCQLNHPTGSALQPNESRENHQEIQEKTHPEQAIITRSKRKLPVIPSKTKECL